MPRLNLLGICLISLYFWAEVRTDEIVQEDCDDKGVTDAVDQALVEYNKKLGDGNQFALHQIINASKTQNESGTVYFLNFDARESNCHVKEEKAWRDCDYLLQSNKDPIQCTSEVHKGTLQENQEVVSISCDVEHPVKAKHAPCLGCPEPINTENEDLKDPITYSITKFNSAHDSGFHFVLYTIASATRQVVAGLKYKLQFDMVKSNCSKSEFSEVTDICYPADEKEEFAHCNSTVYIAPWRREEPETDVSCASGLLPSVFIKRRPPGWSPLRNIQSEASVLSHATPTEAPAKTKEDSSEESQEQSLPSPDPSNSTVTQTAPFNCPSKPWKKYEYPATPVTPRPEVVQGDLSDLDLL